MPTEAYKAYLFFLVDLMGKRDETDTDTEHVCAGMRFVCMYVCYGKSPAQ